MMTQIQMPLTGTALRDIGMSKAVDHAERETPGWTEETITALRMFCESMRAEGIQTFLMEHFRATQYKHLPPSPNCWGAIARIAARRGIIRWTGEYRSAKSIKTHAHPVKVWMVL